MNMSDLINQKCQQYLRKSPTSIFNLYSVNSKKHVGNARKFQDTHKMMSNYQELIHSRPSSLNLATSAPAALTPAIALTWDGTLVWRMGTRDARVFRSICFARYLSVRFGTPEPP